LERIGEGGTGVVYRAKQLAVDRVSAIKVLGAHVSTDPSWVKRFHNEARAASRLDHPNTVRLIDFGQTKEGLLFIAMEFMHGRSLRQEIERLGRLPPNRVLRILSQMCASLSEAHNQGIIHRDIKPDQLYLGEIKGAGRRQQSAEALDSECQQCLADLFPRQTPGPSAVPVLAAQPEMKTMMAQEAPKLGTSPGYAPPAHGGYGSPTANPGMAEQKTMM